jgi:hypothetical protein
MPIKRKLDEKAFRKRYMQYYNEAQSLIDKHDPCGTRRHEEAGLCLEDVVYHGGKSRPIRCCPGCPHHNVKTGCSVLSLSCKIWFCGLVRDNQQPGMDEFIEKMRALKERVYKVFPYSGIRRTIEEDWAAYQRHVEYVQSQEKAGLVRRAA